jgi:hypothetical protein
MKVTQPGSPTGQEDLKNSVANRDWTGIIFMRFVRLQPLPLFKRRYNTRAYLSQAGRRKGQVGRPCQHTRDEEKEIKVAD